MAQVDAPDLVVEIEMTVEVETRAKFDVAKMAAENPAVWAKWRKRADLTPENRIKDFVGECLGDCTADDLAGDPAYVKDSLRVHEGFENVTVRVDTRQVTPGVVEALESTRAEW